MSNLNKVARKEDLSRSRSQRIRELRKSISQRITSRHQGKENLDYHPTLVAMDNMERVDDMSDEEIRLFNITFWDMPGNFPIKDIMEDSGLQQNGLNGVKYLEPLITRLEHFLRCEDMVLRVSHLYSDKSTEELLSLLRHPNVKDFGGKIHDLIADRKLTEGEYLGILTDPFDVTLERWRRDYG